MREALSPLPPPLDGKRIAHELWASRDNPNGLQFWAGMAAARLRQYQQALEQAGIKLPEEG